METFEALKNVEWNYLLTIASSVAYFYNMLTKIFPLKESSVSQRSNMSMRELKLLYFVRKQCVFTAVHVDPPETRSLSHTGRHKKKSHTSMRQGTKGN